MLVSGYCHSSVTSMLCEGIKLYVLVRGKKLKFGTSINYNL